MEIFPSIDLLIPQKSPFVMVDNCIFHSEELTKSEFLIGFENVLVDEGFLTAYGLIENMAQTAAIRAGLEAYNRNNTPPVGYIGTISNAVISELPKVGNIIVTSVKQKTQLLNIIVIEAECKLEEKLLAQCEMKIVLMETQANTNI